MTRPKTSHLNPRLFAAVTTLLIACALTLWLWPTATRAAPNVTFHTLDGQIIELQSFRGKPVLVNFWATSCSSCVKEIPHLISLHQELAPRGLEMVAVAMSYDPPNHVLELSEAAELPYRVSLDIDASIATAFGDVELTPSTFLVDPMGNIALYKLGSLDMDALRNLITTYL